jgi:prepilin-type N-terminal cleavage/methylation domain-containing protein
MLVNGILNLESSFRDAGFTLLELLVVLSLISLLFFLAIPQFQGGIPADSSRRSLLQLKQTIESLKTRAVEKQTDHALHLNLDTRQIWITDEAMDEEERLLAKQEGFSWTDALLLEDVEFPDQDKTAGGEVALYFYKKGYSDRARIHLRPKDGSQAALLVEPFLSSVQIETGHVSFRQ